MLLHTRTLLKPPFVPHLALHDLHTFLLRTLSTMSSAAEVATIVNVYEDLCAHASSPSILTHSDQLCRWIVNLCGISTVGLVTFEHAITLGCEVSLVWRNGKINGASAMLLANRYIMLASEWINLFAAFIPETDAVRGNVWAIQCCIIDTLWQRFVYLALTRSVPFPHC